jgi:urease accessory protein
MKRALAVKAAGGWSEAAAVDRVVLDADGRFRRRMLLIGESGTTFLLDLAQPTPLREGDGLVLEDGSIVRVEGKPERLLETGAANAADLARLAWHLGNRHADIQIVGERLRIRRDHVLEAMLRGLGATVTEIETTFHPEPGAYGRDVHE